MAALRGTIRSDRSRVTRLSHRALNVHADTWRTFSEIELNADGSGVVRVVQNGATIVRASWSAESAEKVQTTVTTRDGQ